MPQTQELCLPTPLSACYATEQELTASLQRKASPQPCAGLYPRDGTEEVCDIEAAISELTIPDQRLNVVVSSGMAAVSGAVRFALRRQGEEHHKAPLLAYSRDLYPQSTRSFEGLRNMGVSATAFDAGNPDSVNRLLERKSPDVIFAETVANTMNTSVLDIHSLLSKTRPAGEEGPIIVLDNTLPLSTSVDFNDILTPQDRVLVVESVTKGGMHNSGHLGAVYSKDPELMDEFRKFKATEGIVTSTHADVAILRTLEATTPGFHDRNRALYASTGKIAVALAGAQQGQGSDPEFTISFPTLPDHPNHAYAEDHLPDGGGSPVVFMACTRFAQGAAKELLKRISDHPSIREQIKEGQIFLGQSFGFKEARLLYDANACQVRVSGGYNIDSDALAAALKEAAIDV